jgi:molecular chaperone GrpE
VTDSNERISPHSDDSSQADEDSSRVSGSAPAHTDKRGEGQAPPEAAPNPLESVTAERDKLREQLLRTAADFDNYRKRSKRDVDDARQRGKEDLVRDFLPVFDNLERAVQTADTATDMRAVVDGVRMVLKLFEDSAERIGLSRVPSLGERFDPAVHEAIQQQETDAHPAGTIITEVVPGYRFGQRLVRPAMVIVARSKPSGPKSESSKLNGDASAPPAAASDASSAKPVAGASRPPPSGAASSSQKPGPSAGDEPEKSAAEPKDTE